MMMDEGWFVARRGQVKDDGTNFTMYEKRLRVMIIVGNQKKIRYSFLRNGIKWNFNSPTASHHGGVEGKVPASVIRL